MRRGGWRRGRRRGPETGQCESRQVNGLGSQTYPCGGIEGQREFPEFANRLAAKPPTKNQLSIGAGEGTLDIQLGKLGIFQGSQRDGYKTVQRLPYRHQ